VGIPTGKRCLVNADVYGHPIDLKENEKTVVLELNDRCHHIQGWVREIYRAVEGEKAGAGISIAIPFQIYQILLGQFLLPYIITF